jgi:hypothetical protein
MRDFISRHENPASTMILLRPFEMTILLPELPLPRAQM